MRYKGEGGEAAINRERTEAMADELERIRKRSKNKLVIEHEPTPEQLEARKTNWMWRAGLMVFNKYTGEEQISDSIMDLSLDEIHNIYRLQMAEMQEEKKLSIANRIAQYIVAISHAELNVSNGPHPFTTMSDMEIKSMGNDVY